MSSDYFLAQLGSLWV